jgi:condensin complex subunit 3
VRSSACPLPPSLRCSGSQRHSEEVYQDLRAALLDRINDKESPVRVQAVIGLSKLCGSEEPGDVEDNEQTATETLLDLLAHDPAA